MTQYVLSEVDPSVDAAYGTLEELGLVSEGDRTDHIPFTQFDQGKHISTEAITQRYGDIEKQDDLLIVLNGSGTFHHHTYGFCRGILEQDERDYTVLHFDQHGDSRYCNGTLDCGNYLGKLVRDSEHAKKGIIIGADVMVSDSDWMDPRYLASDLEVYPYRRASAVFDACQDGELDVNCVEQSYNADYQENSLTWHTVAEEGITAIARRALDRTPTENVYITVDLDALTGRYVNTDWGNGKMSLDQLLDAISLVKEEKNIIGLDITGTDGTGRDRETFYTIAAIVNEVKDGPYDREFFEEHIGGKGHFMRNVRNFFGRLGKAFVPP